MTPDRTPKPVPIENLFDFLDPDESRRGAYTVRLMYHGEEEVDVYPAAAQAEAGEEAGPPEAGRVAAQRAGARRAGRRCGVTPFAFALGLMLVGIWLFVGYMLIDLVRERSTPRLVRMGFGFILLGWALLPVAALLGELKVTP